MRIAFVSPLPPAKSGIADYSKALLAELERVAEVSVFPGEPPASALEVCDIALYQIGNNADHLFAYEAALKHPGIVVLHEANLHHLICDLTIRRQDWDRYLAEVEYDAGPTALDHARQVQLGRTGPDYDGVPMLRRLLQRSRALIVHSRFVADRARAAGFEGPIEVIPHGVWFPEISGAAHRRQLGVSDSDVLAGIFGHLKPYKRVREALRAFRRVARERPEVKLILVGETHPDLPVESLIETMGLAAQVQLIGYTPIEEFEGYLAACDFLLNLRHPTVGESSGTMMRALGLGKPVIVSEVGAFAEFPEDVCLKTPVDGREEDYLAEYLALLASNPGLRAEIGARAQAWARKECAWPVVARRYADFARQVAFGSGTAPEAAAEPEAAETVPPQAELPAPTDWGAGILAWCASEGAREYARGHLARLRRTLDLVPPGTPKDRILEMGAYMQITPLLGSRLGYGTVRGCYYGPAGRTDSRSVRSADGEEFSCEVDLFDAEKDRFPYGDGHFSTVLCCELIEHLPGDPMHLMSEINRVLAPGGCLVLTTPNIASLRAISAILAGYHPGFFPAYIRPSADGSVDARHAREYTPREIYRLFEDAGFEVVRLETGPFDEQPHPELRWVESLLHAHDLDADYRGECIFCVGRKRGAPGHRYPDWLYTGGGFE